MDGVALRHELHKAAASVVSGLVAVKAEVNGLDVRTVREETQPVSYTHLDVYKRQALEGELGGGPSGGGAIRAPFCEHVCGHGDLVGGAHGAVSYTHLDVYKRQGYYNRRRAKTNPPARSRRVRQLVKNPF